VIASRGFVGWIRRASGESVGAVWKAARLVLRSAKHGGYQANCVSQAKNNTFFQFTGIFLGASPSLQARKV
jgi:hypothetical protein